VALPTILPENLPPEVNKQLEALDYYGVFWLTSRFSGSKLGIFSWSLPYKGRNIQPSEVLCFHLSVCWHLNPF